MPIRKLAINHAAALALALLTCLAISACAQAPVPAQPVTHWAASWQASPQPVWGQDFLFPSHLPPQLQGQTVQQVARISLGGQGLRVQLSNAHGQQPVTVGRATVALAASASGQADGLHPLRFGGQTRATIAPGATLLSDPLALPVPNLARLQLNIHLPEPTPMTTFHWDGRQTSFIVPGDQTGARALPQPSEAVSAAGSATHGKATAQGNAPGSVSTTARPLLSGIWVQRPRATPVVVALGDSITDGATASLDQDSRWPDFLAQRLAPHGVAVVNAGISGARLLSDGMGLSALARLQRDALAQPGVAVVVVLLGINDIAWPGTAFAPQAKAPTLAELQAGLLQLREQAHSQQVRFVAATLTPFAGALPGTPLANYFQPGKEALRQQLNDWIRHSQAFDAVIDFDAALRDPAQPTRLAPQFDSGDHLHPGDAGNRAMAEAIDLRALLPGLMQP